MIFGNGGNIKLPLVVVSGREPVEQKQLVMIYSRALAADGEISTEGTHLILREVNTAH